MKNTITILLLLGAFTVNAQTYPFTNKVTNGQVATVWDNDYYGNIYIKNDTIFITPNNEKAPKFAYRILKSKTKIVGTGKKGATVTSYSVESIDSIDDDVKVKMALTLFNKPHKTIGSRFDSLRITFRDTFTETNSVVEYFIVR
jgi:hypothetical protein